MKLTKLKVPVAFASLGILLASLAISNVAAETPPGSDHQIEIIRAHAAYENAPVFTPQGPLIPANPSADVMLGRESSRVVGTAQQVQLLQLAGYIG